MSVRRVAVPVSIVLLAALLGVPPVGAVPGKTVTVTPDSDLVDFQTVHVEGTGFEPGALLEIFECRSDAVDEVGCDADNAFFADADASGVVNYDFVVDARIYDHTGTETDCRVAPGICTIGVGFILDHADSVFAPLAFDPDAPFKPAVAVTVAPDIGLVDGQQVVVSGSNLSPREQAWAWQCITDVPLSEGPCDFNEPPAARGVPGDDGTIELVLPVNETLVTNSGEFDCTAAPGACSIVLSWGFSFAPDRTAAAPITFGDSPTTTSTSVAAAPVAEQPTFTG